MELHGIRGVDIAAYSSDGLHFWPCGEMFSEGRDDEEDVGVKFCRCETCEKVRVAIYQEWEGGDSQSPSEDRESEFFVPKEKERKKIKLKQRPLDI